jgi:hypothetical protein
VAGGLAKDYNSWSGVVVVVVVNFHVVGIMYMSGSMASCWNVTRSDIHGGECGSGRTGSII